MILIWIKKRMFFNFALISVMIFMFSSTKCKASFIDVKSAQIDSIDFEENEQELFATIPDDVISIFQENYMNDIFSYLERDKSTNGVDFREIWELLIHGNVLEAGKKCVENVGISFWEEIEKNNNLFVSLISSFVISALFFIITDVFKSGQTEEIGKILMHFLLMLMLGKSFFSLYGTAEEIVLKIVDFVKVLLPAYAAAIGLSGTTGYAVAYYELILFLIFCVENLLFKFLLPTIKLYVVLIFVAGIWNRERLRIIQNTLKKGIEISLKVFLWVLSSMGILQSMITPAAEALKVNGVKKMISVIPGIGNISEGISDIFLGSTVLIKNSIGVLITAILLGICLVPLIEIFVCSLLVKLAGMIGSMLEHSGLADTTNSMADAGFLLWKTVFTALGLFLMSIAISILAVKGVV